MFWLLFSLCAYIFIAFKVQQSASLLLPALDDSTSSKAPFFVVLGLTLAANVLAVLIRIYE